MSTIPGLFVLGEANFSDHGANRLGASALMQGLADGYFVLPYTIGDYLARRSWARRSTPTHAGVHARSKPRCDAQVKRLLAIQRQAQRSTPSTASSASSCWDHCGMAPQRRRACARRSRRSPRCARSSGTTCACPAPNEEPQPVAREGRPRGRLLRARRADVPGRAGARASPAAATSARSTRPPDGEAQRDDENFSLRRGLGVDGRRPGARAAQGAARRSSTCSPRSGATSRCRTHSPRLAPEQSPRRPAAWSRYEVARRRRAHVVPRDARRGQRAADRPKGEEPIAFDHDCREGICGMCGFMINGVAARPAAGDHGLPAAHAPLQGRRRADARAVARPRPSRCSTT